MIRDIRNAPARYTDETSWRINGENVWLWAFVTKGEALYKIANSRSHKVPLKVVGKNANGADVCLHYKTETFIKGSVIMPIPLKFGIEMTRKTNPNLINLIKDLKRLSIEQNAPIWHKVAVKLEKPSSRWAEVNLNKVSRFTTKHETVLIPGKLLGTGNLDKPVTVAAYQVSSSAKTKVVNADGKVLTIMELIEQNPKGSGVRILG